MAKRWILENTTEGEVPDVDAFLADIERVCREHGLSLAHEDCHGAFLVEPFDEQTLEWLKDAMDARKLGRKS